MLKESGINSERHKLTRFDKKKSGREGGNALLFLPTQTENRLCERQYFSQHQLKEEGHCPLAPQNKHSTQTTTTITAAVAITTTT